MQLGLKRATADGDECDDGQKPAEVRRGRPKATAKAKAKGKAKASPKAKAKAKASAKAKAKAKALAKAGAMAEASPMEDETEQANDQGHGHEDGDELRVALPKRRANKRKGEVEPVGEEACEPSGCTESPKVPKAKAKASASGKKKAKLVEKKDKDKAKKEVEEDNKEKDNGKIEKNEVKLKCFAKRRRPTRDPLRWDALRHAFQLRIKPHLTTYSAHEDCALGFEAHIFPGPTSADVLLFHYQTTLIWWNYDNDMIWW